MIFDHQHLSIFSRFTSLKDKAMFIGRFTQDYIFSVSLHIKAINFLLLRLNFVLILYFLKFLFILLVNLFTFYVLLEFGRIKSSKSFLNIQFIFLQSLFKELKLRWINKFYLLIEFIDVLFNACVFILFFNKRGICIIQIRIILLLV